MKKFSFTIIAAYFLFLFSKYSSATHTITPSEPISDANSSSRLVSRDGRFELGFFSPGSSKNRYVGIWYTIDPSSVVWVANRQNPVNDSSGILKIDQTGNLAIVANETTLWSSSLTKTVQNPTLQLLDSGNLVLRDEKDANSVNILWESFDYPTDTMLPDMKFGVDLRTGLIRKFTAWRNADDPSPGDLTYAVEVYHFPQMVMRKGSKKFFRDGPWNGIGRSGFAPIKDNSVSNVSFVYNDMELYAIFNIIKSVMIKIVLNQSQSAQVSYAADPKTAIWSQYDIQPKDQCDNYGVCGPFGNCVINMGTICQCLKGFRPASPDSWLAATWSQGCVRNNPICQKGDGFVKVGDLKLPDTENTWVNKSMNIEECRAKCLKNCSCSAYTHLNISGKGSGCSLWYGNLTDMRHSQFGQDLYIRMSASDLDSKIGAKVKIAVIIAAAVTAGSGILVICYCWKKRRSRAKWEQAENMQNDENEPSESHDDLQLPLFDLTTIINATDNFASNNKLGEGGFGPVYKGTLEDGNEIAVKRLSRISGQGMPEFKNEVILIAKLQHRNLVRLLGCCIKGEEKMLIYEYMPNKSLDTFIFDEKRGKQLDWPKRFNIICGIARGLLYLHQDSRLRIVHRDLKTSNVLLDEDMNPKISDFGLARTFGGDQTEANTNRVVGTYGYMAPEYASDGLFSVKSDVFSFGVLSLEIICGKRSRGFYNPSQGLNLIGHAWKLWKEGRPLELVDNNLADTVNTSEIIRCIQISLLCVQQYPEERPSVASVVMMLGSEIALPKPKQPGFVKDRGPTEAYSAETSSTNEMSVTSLQPR